MTRRGEGWQDPLLAALGGRPGMSADVYDHDSGRHLGVAASPGLEALLARCPYRTIVSQAWAAEIRAVWAPDKGCALPIPPGLLSSLSETFESGGGVLLACNDSETRDVAKAVLTAMFGPIAGGRH